MDIFKVNFKNRMTSETSYKCAAVISAMTTLGIGLISSWSSPALPHLISSKSKFPVSEFQGAWIASVLGCGMIFGFIVNPIIVNRLGAKRTLLFLAAPQILSWIIIYLGRNWLLLCFVRIIGGFGYGAGMCSTAIYLSEIGDEKTRGIFLTLVKMSINIGIFVAMIFGAFLSYDTMNLVSIFIPIVFVVVFFPMPDKKDSQEDDFDDGVQEQLWQNDFDDVRKQKITDGDEEDSNVFANEANGLKAPLSNLTESKNRIHDHPNAFHEDSGAKQRQHNLESSKNVWWKLFMLKNNRKALMIVILMGLTDIFSGHMVIATYTQQIFEYSGASLPSQYSALILALLKIGASLISTLVVEKFSRRGLLLSTGIFAGLSQGSVALFYFLKLYIKIDISWITWWPLFGITIYEIASNVGIGSLYFVYQGELFSDDVKGLGITFSNIFFEFVSFFFKLFFQIIINAVGIYFVFFGFAICCTAGSCFVYKILPETKGRNKKEIKKLLM